MDTINSIIIPLFAAIAVVIVLLYANNLTHDDDEPHTPAAGMGA
jgi:hypothetical protein